MIGIVDYGMGNLGSVYNACVFLGLDARILCKPSEMDTCGAVILPGVGAFGDCMEHLHGHGFTIPLKNWIAADRPFLGICLGLQVLFAESDESPGIKGLDILPGRVKRFELGAKFKIPQIGWNQVRQTHANTPMFRDIKDNSFFYFVHSYYVATPDQNVVVGSTNYDKDYTSAVRLGNVMAVQFHPEKSQSSGLRVLKNFGDLYEKSVK